MSVRGFCSCQQFFFVISVNLAFSSIDFNFSPLFSVFGPTFGPDVYFIFFFIFFLNNMRSAIPILFYLSIRVIGFLYPPFILAEILYQPISVSFCPISLITHSLSCAFLTSSFYASKPHNFPSLSVQLN